MGDAPKFDIKRGLFFGLLGFISLRFRSLFDGLKTDHGWADWQIDLFVMVVSSVLIFACFSLLFARPVMTVSWILGDSVEQLGPSLPIQKDGPPTDCIVLIRIAAQSALGVFAMRCLKRLRLVPVVRLGSPPYVRLVAERNCNSFTQPGPSGFWAVRSDWEATLSRGSLDCRAVVTFPVVAAEVIAGNKHEMAYELRRHPAPVGPLRLLVQGACRLVARFVVVKAKVTHIYVQ